MMIKMVDKYIDGVRYYTSRCYSKRDAKIIISKARQIHEVIYKSGDVKNIIDTYDNLVFPEVNGGYLLFLNACENSNIVTVKIVEEKLRKTCYPNRPKLHNAAIIDCLKDGVASSSAEIIDFIAEIVPPGDFKKKLFFFWLDLYQETNLFLFEYVIDKYGINEAMYFKRIVEKETQRKQPRKNILIKLYSQTECHDYFQTAATNCNLLACELIIAISNELTPKMLINRNINTLIISLIGMSSLNIISKYADDNAINELTIDYVKDPDMVRKKMIVKHGIKNGAAIFALVIFLCDDFLVL